MAGNRCPVCSGEIMTYRRFLKKVEPSGMARCQCCGARLHRSQMASAVLIGLALGGAGIAAWLIVLAARNAFPAWGTVGIVLGLGVTLAWSFRHRSWAAVREPGARRLVHP